jgi:hypothetical protein
MEVTTPGGCVPTVSIPHAREGERQAGARGGVGHSGHMLAVKKVRMDEEEWGIGIQFF